MEVANESSSVDQACHHEEAACQQLGSVSYHGYLFVARVYRLSGGSSLVLHVRPCRSPHRRRCHNYRTAALRGYNRGCEELETDKLKVSISDAGPTTPTDNAVINMCIVVERRESALLPSEETLVTKDRLVLRRSAFGTE